MGHAVAAIQATDTWHSKSDSSLVVAIYGDGRAVLADFSWFAQNCKQLCVHTFHCEFLKV